MMWTEFKATIDRQLKECAAPADVEVAYIDWNGSEPIVVSDASASDAPMFSVVVLSD